MENSNIQNKQNFNSANTQQEDGLDLREIALKFLTHWHYFALCLFAALVIAGFYIYYATPIYKTESSVLIKEDGDPMSSLLMPTDYIFGKKGNVDNEIGVLQSFSLTREVVEELGFHVSYFVEKGIKTPEIYKDSPFIVEVDTYRKQSVGIPIEVNLIDKNTCRIKYKEATNVPIYDFASSKIEEQPVLIDISKEDCDLTYGQWYEKNGMRFRIYLKEKISLDEELTDNSYIFTINDPDGEALHWQQNTMAVLQTKQSSIVTLSTQGTVPSKCMDFLNALSSAYIKRNLDEKNYIHESTIHFVNEQINLIASSLNDAEKRREEFRRDHNTMNLEGESALLYEKASELETQRAAEYRRSQYYDYLLKYINSSDELQTVVAPATMGIEDPLLNTLVKEMSVKIAERQRKAIFSTDKNPQLQLLDSEIQNLRNQIEENVRNITKLSVINKKSIEQQLNTLQHQLDRLPSTERYLINLERQFKFNDEIYNFLYKKRAEAEIAKNAALPDHKIIDQAQFSVKTAPRSFLIVLIAIFLGLLSPAAFIFLREYFNTKITGKKDIEKVSNSPIIGYIYENPNSKNRLAIFEDPKSALAESFRSVRTNIQYLTKGAEKTSIVVTSSMQGDGKSFTSQNLASIFSLSGKKVVLAEYDLRKPKYYKVFNIENKAGISTYLSHRSSYEDIIRTTAYDNLDIVVAGPIPPNPSELIDSPENVALIERLKQDYDVVILDTPPVGLITDAFVLMKEVDISLYVVRQMQTQRKVFNAIVQDIEKRNLAKLNFLLNGIPTDRSQYGYGYGYGYGYYSGDDNKEKSKKKRKYRRSSRKSRDD